MSKVLVKFADDDGSGQILRKFSIDSFLEQTLTDCVIYCQNFNFDYQDDRKVSSNTLPFGSMINHQEKYRQFHCHRLILSAYSDFFRQHFCSMAKISNSLPIIYLDNIDSHTMDNILKLIYDGFISISTEKEKNDFIEAAIKIGLKQISMDDLIVSKIAAQQQMKLYSNNNRTIEKSETATAISTNHLKKQLLTTSGGSNSCSSSSSKTKPMDLDDSIVPQQSSSATLSLNRNNKKHKVSDVVADISACDEANYFGGSGELNQTRLLKERSLVQQQDFAADYKSGSKEMIEHQMMPIINATMNANNNPNILIANNTLSSSSSSTSTSLSSSQFKCPYCQQQYKYEISLKKHIKSVHSNLN